MNSQDKNGTAKWDKRRLSRRTWIGGGLLVCAVLSMGIFRIFFTLPLPTALHSGGLGLTREEWRQRYQEAYEPMHFPFIESMYEDKNQDTSYHWLYSLEFWPDTWLMRGSARIGSINPAGWGTVPSDMETKVIPKLIKQLIPEDSQLLQQHVQAIDDPTQFADIYHSTELATRYPSWDSAPDPWRGQPAGTFYVVRGKFMLITIPESRFAPKLQGPANK